jgi:hypothetical protein
VYTAATITACEHFKYSEMTTELDTELLFYDLVVSKLGRLKKIPILGDLPRLMGH